jgi:hypothetical protein
VFPPECVCCIILDHLLHASRWNYAIVPDFQELFEDFKEEQFTLLWRGSRDGFGRGNFHGRCDGHANTLTVILDTNGNIFGGFNPVEWNLPENAMFVRQKADPERRESADIQHVP